MWGRPHRRRMATVARSAGDATEPIMHPAITHELTRAVLADRERDARAGIHAHTLDGETARARHARSTRAPSFLARLRRPADATRPTRKAGAHDAA